MTRGGLRWVFIAGLTVWPVHSSAEPQTSSFTLGKYIPRDCWMFVHGVHNPARDFIDAHWSRVFAEVKKSGIDLELRKLILGDLSEAERVEAEQAWDAAVKLVQGVRWSDLVAKEMAFAERLGPIPPELMLLCRTTAGHGETHAQGLKAILDTLASFWKEAAVTETTVHDIRVWKLEAPGSPLSLHVFYKGDVVGMVLGERGADDVLALLAGQSGPGAIVDTPRFRQAAAELPPAQEGVGFFDLQMLVRNMDQMFTTIFAQHAAGGEPDERTLRSKRLLAKLLEQCDFLDYIMFVSGTEGLREMSTSTIRLRADALDKPLCRMLTAQKPFAKFDRYVPKEASGFSVSSSLDLRQLYQSIVDFIRQEVPEGEQGLTRWADLQKTVNFDLEADLFSWWSGEMVSVSLPPAVKGPFSTADSVRFIRVKDPTLAAAKVNAGIDRLATLLRERDQNLILSDASEVNAPGFRSVTHPLVAMYGFKFILGVTDDHLVIGNSAAGINACLDTAAGKRPSILENERFQKEGLVPVGPLCAASFTDLSNLGQELSSVFFMMGLMGTMIPDKAEARPYKAIISMLGRLSPAIAQIDFLNSSSSICTFDGRGWTTREALNYKPAPAPPTAPPTLEGGKGTATTP